VNGVFFFIEYKTKIAFACRIYHKDEPLNPTFPSEVPTKIIQPSLPPENQALPTTIEKSILEAKDELLKLNPPTPCYKSLRNNVATPLLKYDDFSWPQDTVSSSYVQLYIA
jgi:hypothetical protein